MKNRFNRGKYGNKNEKHEKCNYVIMRKIAIILMLLCVVTLSLHKV